MGVEISIVVPVYNIEHLLPKCIDSILDQSYTNLELILVNDGSTDRSGEICDHYAKVDSRIKVVHKKNGGTASSRNAGIKAANGNYIGFVDNDDYINKYMFETLYNIAVLHSSDIVICDYLNVDEGNNQNKNYFYENFPIQHLNNLEALNHIFNNNSTFVYPWNKLYRKSLFNDIIYEVGNLYDDETVAHRLLYKCSKITYVQAELYYYVKRLGSMVNTPFHIKKLDRVYALKNREIFFRTKKEVELHQKALKQYMEVFYWYYFMAKSNLTGVDKDLRKLKRTFDKSLIYLLMNNKISWKQKVMCLIFSLNPTLFKLFH